MTIRRLLFLSVILTLGACGSGQASKNNSGDNVSKGQTRLLGSVSPSFSTSVRQGDIMEIGFQPTGEIDSARVWVADSLIAVVTGDSRSVAYLVPAGKMGSVVYKVEALRGTESHTLTGRFMVVSPVTPQNWNFSIVATYPHSPDAYTQGLLWHDGFLYESVGEYGHSSLRKVDPVTGKVLRKQDMADEYFGEGLTLVGGKFYQVTWLEQKGFIYDPVSLEVTGEFSYGGEGWGIASDGTKIYMSDGSETITVYDPQGFRKVRFIGVYDDQGPVRMLNEMEWIDGRIWANIYLTDRVAVIDPTTGIVEAYIDFGALKDKIGNRRSADVFNGIAYDHASGRIFVTGKKWDKLFEVKIVKQ